MIASCNYPPSSVLNISTTEGLKNTFTNEDLVDGVLTETNNFDATIAQVVVTNADFEQVIPDAVYFTTVNGVNYFNIDLQSQTPLVGGWHYKIL